MHDWQKSVKSARKEEFQKRKKVEKILSRIVKVF